MKPTIEDLALDGVDIHRCLTEETILVHTGDFNANTCSARIIVSMTLPDGRVMEVNRVLKLRLTEREGRS